MMEVVKLSSVVIIFLYSNNQIYNYFCGVGESFANANRNWPFRPFRLR